MPAAPAAALDRQQLRWRLFAAAYAGHADGAVAALQQLERAAHDADDSDDEDARAMAATRAVHGGHAKTAAAILAAAQPAGARPRARPRADGLSLKVVLSMLVTSRRIDVNDAASLVHLAVDWFEGEMAVGDVDGLLNAASFHGKQLLADALVESLCERTLR